jgi:YD repeat-containing protein
LTNVADNASRRIAIFYDGNNHIQKVIDPLNRTNSYTYSNGHLISVSDTLGTRVTYAYDDTNYNPDAITRVIDARNNTHRYVFDASGAVSSERPKSLSAPSTRCVGLISGANRCAAGHASRCSSR